MKKLILVGCITVFLALFVFIEFVSAVDRGCNITSFTMSPSGPNFNLGDVISLDGRSNCGTVKFEIDGQSRSEIGSTNQTMNLNTSEWGNGSHQVCFVARGEGGWENADRRCNTINVTGTPTQPPPPSRGCDITSFTMSPSGPNYNLGDIIRLEGTSNCGTVKFEIDGQSYAEIGSTNQTAELKTSEWGAGSHSVCFVARGEGGWEMADRRCNTISVSSVPLPPPPPAGRGCDIASFTMSPSGPNYNLGDVIHLDGRSNCGTVKFEIDGQSRSEIGSTNQSMDLNTNEWGAGSHQVCFVARGEGGWEMADRRCNTISVSSVPLPPPPPAGRGCDITSFSMSPSGPNYNLGDVIRLDGRSNCGTVKFEIDGRSYAEIGSTNQTAELKTSEWGSGVHQVCFVARGEGGWENADRECKTINVSSAPPPPPPSTSRGCDITSFTMSPAGPNFKLGDVIYLDGRSNCGTVKFEIDGQSRSEIDSTNQSMDLNTNEWGAGSHQVCFVARGESGWENADLDCKNITLGATPTTPENPSNPSSSVCFIDSFIVTPTSPQPGVIIKFSGAGHCNGVTVRAVRFSINGDPYGEIGAPSQSVDWNTASLSTGNYVIGFHVAPTGDPSWQNAAASYITVRLSTASSSSGSSQTDGSSSGSSSNDNPPPFTSPFIELPAINWNDTPKPIDWGQTVQDASDFLDAANQTTSVVPVQTGSQFINNAAPIALTGLQGGAELINGYYSNNPVDTANGVLDVLTATSAGAVALVAAGVITPPGLVMLGIATIFFGAPIARTLITLSGAK